ncbi:serine/threonine-protein phosphatase PGAM5, mitochondrial-like isoform X1 [Neodiprion pinetum]|uniref:Serine/threonine-protein phosphatase PGAM5, mitochondrial n=1 Tax=Neodiprion lecontei TaxID=441921 RepID=A0A6J0B5Z0_NEOLC|nr:serine/threonine-protein phosphatase PGAM5, mitochondrial isoform X1 [Neodiprion lecontei]XP_046416908.1 serine/threonine-protein phosphatase PGAM5, mitochondrial-like isoform X1 [Neodiprion fabricii]XP_046472776.1 serine/threonine-protein phosphatase PGAM5, mitochondrial-like isoform X1 [Neodiprion pinetum]XP_046472777.1 serine/threonine-protein phosphatase PGAM5, mitochondrial-like isoform X1 [Neodiprion pinetum]XP_046590164.1 serine/threonine-protein phosphatase PGAM5, mitochondrial isofo
MPGLTKFQKYAISGLGVVGGAALLYYNVYGGGESMHVLNSWTTNFTPSVQWEHNWDRREPKSLVKPVKINSESDENRYNEDLASQKVTATRNLFLIRHGQYNTNGKTDCERILTNLGRIQAESTGSRLVELNYPYTLIVRSTMSRAQETSKIIEKNFPEVPTKDDSLLEEGAPIPPEPPVGHWKPENYQFFQDGARIEAAFRRYFHRADPKQTQDSYTVLVCHANVIRYFVCRALQFPPEAWLRLSLNHASITWIRISPSGRVTLRCLGDTGHMLPQNVTAN